MKLLVKATGFILVALGLTGATKAESSCLAAVAQQAGSSEGSIISAERGENATIVLVLVPGAQAPRRPGAASTAPPVSSGSSTPVRAETRSDATHCR